MPYTVGPHELWPTPAAPHSVMRRTSSSLGPGANVPPCTGANQRPLIAWIAVSAAPNVARSASASAGSSAISARCATRSASCSGGGGSCANAASSAPPFMPGAESGTATTQRHAGGNGSRASSGATPSPSGLPAAFEHQAAAGERPRANRRSARASDRLREPRGVDVELVQLCQRPRHGQRELRARSEAGMRGKAPVHADAGAAGGEMRRGALAGQEPARELRRAAGRIVSGDFERGGRTRRDEQRRRRRGRADAAEQASERAAEIEQAEVEARRRFDEDGRVRVHALSGLVRTCSVRSAIASNSWTPAVLSTITWSRWSSLSTNARGSRCRRVA